MKILYIVAHPYLRESRSNRAVLESVENLPGLTTHALYDHYPYFHIDVRREMELLRAHDMLVVQHPFYWYSMPALMRHWLGEVFQSGWAYGEGGDNLKGKKFLLSLTVGGPAESYAHDGYNRFPMDTFLAPWNQTVHLCGMKWCPPEILYNSIKASDEQLRVHGQKIRGLLQSHLEGRA